MPYTLAEAAAACGLDKSTVRRAVRAGRISGTRDDLGCGTSSRSSCTGFFRLRRAPRATPRQRRETPHRMPRPISWSPSCAPSSAPASAAKKICGSNVTTGRTRPRTGSAKRRTCCHHRNRLRHKRQPRKPRRQPSLQQQATGSCAPGAGCAQRGEAMAVLTQFIIGLIGGVAGWFVTQFVAEPLRRFFGIRQDIAQRLLDYENVRAPRNERGDVTEGFTEEDEVRLRDAQKKFRDLATQTISFVQTDALAARLIAALWRYDPKKAGRSLIGLSHSLAVYGNERYQHRNGVRNALHLPLS